MLLVPFVNYLCILNLKYPCVPSVKRRISSIKMLSTIELAKKARENEVTFKIALKMNKVIGKKEMLGEVLDMLKSFIDVMSKISHLGIRWIKRSSYCQMLNHSQCLLTECHHSS